MTTDRFIVRCPQCHRPARLMVAHMELGGTWVTASCPHCHIAETLAVEHVPYCDLVASGAQRPVRAMAPK